jgi:hypothetical protein
MTNSKRRLPVKFSQQRNVMMFALLALFGLTLAGCGIAQASDDEIEQAWQTSAHADIESRSFTRWNDDDPAVVPENCARCHSTTGYQDFLGVDGATPGQVDLPVPIGETLK